MNKASIFIGAASVFLVGELALADDIPANFESERLYVASRHGTESVNAKVVEFVGDAERGSIVTARAESLQEIIESKVRYDLTVDSRANPRDTTPVTRREACIRLLGQTNYASLERRAFLMLRSTSAEERVAALGLLGPALVSSKATAEVKKLYQTMMSELNERGLKPDGRMLFGAAEALCYLGDESGIEALESALAAGTAPAFLKVRAINALAALTNRTPLVKLASKQLTEADPRIAYAAFQALESVPSEEQPDNLDSAAQCQVERLVGEMAKGGALSQRQVNLLAKAAVLLKLAVREKRIESAEVERLHSITRFVLGSKSGMCREAVASLFAALADDEDIQEIEAMLGDSSARVRSAGALAVTRCGKEAQKKVVPRLLKLLEDEDPFVRNFALYALRTYRGEKVGNMLSGDQFKREKKRFLDWYNGQR